MNIVLSLLAVSVGHACPLKPSERVVAKVPAACYTMARTAAVEIFANKYPDDRGYVRNTDFARYAGETLAFFSSVPWYISGVSSIAVIKTPLLLRNSPTITAVSYDTTGGASKRGLGLGNAHPATIKIRNKLAKKSFANCTESLPAIVAECFVCFCHFVRVFAFFDGVAAVVECIHQLTRQAVIHGFFAALTSSDD